MGSVVKSVLPKAGFDLSASLPLAVGSQAALCVECKSELRENSSRTTYKTRR
jgi:hypothetical protein